MAKRLSPELRRYAVAGAEQRLLQLAEEAAEIFAIFPELRAPGRGFMARSGRADRDEAGAAAPRRRRKMSAEARKKISDAQKARWKKHKRANKE